MGIVDDAIRRAAERLDAEILESSRRAAKLYTERWMRDAVIPSAVPYQPWLEGRRQARPPRPGMVEDALNAAAERLREELRRR